MEPCHKSTRNVKKFQFAVYVFSKDHVHVTICDYAMCVVSVYVYDRMCTRTIA